MIVGLTGYRGRPGDPGFIGRWLADELRAAGHEVVPLRGDVRERWAWTWAGAIGHVDVVVHLAARVGRLLCERDPADVVQTNAFGTWSVAEACRAKGKRLLYVSSSEAAYEGNLYGLSKRWGEDAAQLLYGDREGDLLIARLFMPYGPGHPPGYGRAALTNWIDQAKRGGVLTVHGGTSRSWCWVGDTAAALRLLIEQWPDSEREYSLGGGGRVWNVGRVDNAEPSLSTAARIRNRYGGRIEIVRKPAGIADHKLPDVEPLYGLGWRPTVELDEGIGLTADWLEKLR